MSPELPASPNLDWLRKRARHLFRAVRVADPEALARARVVPRIAQLDDATLARTFRLADAQHVLAVEHGFASWARLRRAVEDQQPLEIQVERFLAAIRDGNGQRARRLLTIHPAISRANPATAAATGDDAALAEMLARDPGVVRATFGAPDWTPLLYLSASALHENDPAVTEGMRRAAARLLDAGADPNVRMMAEGEMAPLPALYFACVRGTAEVTKLLLERGADPNDGESIYHAAQLDRRDRLELLVEHGADLSRRHPYWNNTPLYFLSGYADESAGAEAATRGMLWMLEHGADPNVPSYESLETPLHSGARGRGVEFARMLLDHGADPDRPRADGRTPYVLALRCGSQEVADLLRERGARATGATALDEVLGACMRGDEASARGRLAAEPSLLAAITDEDRELMGQAAARGNTAGVRALIAIGFDPAWEGEAGTTLHHAAWSGRPETVCALIELGAPLDHRDRRYGSSPLGWAAHGSSWGRRKAEDDYVAVVEALLDAGAGREASVNRWGEGPLGKASPRVAELLKARGFD